MPRPVATSAKRVQGSTAGACAAAIVAGTGIAYWLSAVLGVVSALVIATALGAVARNAGLLPPATRSAISATTKLLLRAGIVLLGLQLSVPELLNLRVGDLIVVTVTVAVTFCSTQWFGRRLGLGRDRSLLLATGFSICGASAIAAMSSVTDVDEDDVASSIALVTLYGSAAIVAYPLLQHPLGLSDQTYALWVGASVHEVAQVVAAAAPAGAAAVVIATVAKLGRVVLLAPMVAAVGVVRRSNADRSAGEKPPIVPVFVVGFLLMCGVRSVDVLPEQALDGANVLTTLLLTAAMFGLGSGVHLPTLVRTGGRLAVVGGLATVVAATTAYIGLTISH